VECRRENVTKEGNSRSVQSATVGVCDLFVLRVVCGRKAPKSICKEGSPGSFDSAPQALCHAIHL
jgi:hypothetical protein